MRGEGELTNKIDDMNGVQGDELKFTGGAAADIKEALLENDRK